MRITNKIYIAIFFLVMFFLNSCIKINKEDEKIIIEKTENYLKNKYSKSFQIKSFQQYFHTLDWQYETSLVAFPTQDSTLSFLVEYDAEKMEVVKDGYQKVFWEKQIENDASEILNKKFSVFSVNAKLSYNKTIPLVPSGFKFYNSYLFLIDKVNLPVLHLEIFIIKDISETEAEIKKMINFENYFSEKTFIETEVEIYFYDEKLLNEKNENLKSIKLNLKRHKYKKYRKRKYRFKFA